MAASKHASDPHRAAAASAPRNSSPHAPHRVLIVGVGSIGERHLRCFLATGRAEVGLVETNPQLRAAVAERYQLPAPRAYARLDEALGAGFTVGLVATPAPLHVPLAARLLDAGLHVLIEKPLSTSLEGVEALKALRDRRRAVVGVAYTYRAFKPLIAMRQALHAGRFGPPVQVVFRGGQHFPFYRPAYRDTYYKDHATGGGAIQDALTHVINAAEWLVGPVDRLAADAAHLMLEGVEVEDTVHLITRHGPVLGSFSLNQHQPANEIELTVVCQRGMARFEGHANRWRWCLGPQDPWHDEAFGPMERDTAYTDQAHAFLDAVEGKAAPACTLEEAEQTLRVNLAALRSAARGALLPLTGGGSTR